MTKREHDDNGSNYGATLPGAETELAPWADETGAHTAWALDDGPGYRPPFWYHLRSPANVPAPMSALDSLAGATSATPTALRPRVWV